MSRRFGRNQRRRARAELADAQAALTTQRMKFAEVADKAIAEHQGRLLAERRVNALRAVVVGVERVLGENSIALPPKQLEHMADNTAEIRFAPRPKWLDCPPAMDEGLTLKALTNEVADILSAEIRSNHVTMRQHFFVWYRDQRVLGYAIDRKVLQSKEGRSAVVRDLAEFLAREFMRQLGEGRIRP